MSKRSLLKECNTHRPRSVAELSTRLVDTKELKLGARSRANAVSGGRSRRRGSASSRGLHSGRGRGCSHCGGARGCLSWEALGVV